jgi:uncharacterized membrane protein YfcA
MEEVSLNELIATDDLSTEELELRGRREMLRQGLIFFAIIMIFGLLFFVPTDGIDQIGEVFNWRLCIVLFFLAFFAEYTSSCVGEGYGLFVAPAMIILGYSPLLIIPAVLISEFVNAIFTTIAHQKMGNIDFKDRRYLNIALVFSLSGVAGAVAAACIAVNIPVLFLKIFIAVVFITTGILILLSGKLKWRFSFRKVVGLGLLASFNKSMAGGGFGPVTTGGQLVMGIEPRRAVAVSKFAKGLTCLSGFLTYVLLRDNVLSWDITLPMAIGASLAAPLAAWTVGGIQHKRLKVIIAGITILLGVMIITFMFIGDSGGAH